eukprot:5859119-Pleurochrysis_carterae.AAC.1
MMSLRLLPVLLKQETPTSMRLRMQLRMMKTILRLLYLMAWRLSVGLARVKRCERLCCGPVLMAQLLPGTTA